MEESSGGGSFNQESSKSVFMLQNLHAGGLGAKFRAIRHMNEALLMCELASRSIAVTRVSSRDGLV